jgi:twitching motility protein PilT
MTVSLESLVLEGRACGASDIHLRSGSVPRFRVDGEMREFAHEALCEQEVLAVLAQVMTSEELGRIRDGVEHDSTISMAGGRSRLHAFRGITGFALVVRLLPGHPAAIEELGLPESVAALAEQRSGLVLVTGAACSGKSTTLAAIIRRINETRAAHVVTIEDPVEVVHVSSRSLITQREVSSCLGGYTTALRSALRQDPDVIMIGELRDAEGIQLALTAAETGHLVLSTLHCSSAVQSVSRMLDVFPAGKQEQARSMLADSLRAVVSQRLYPRAGGGRLLAAEVLIATPAVRNLIREAKTHQLFGLLQTSSQQGMCTFEQHLQQLSMQGVRVAGAK